MTRLLEGLNSTNKDDLRRCVDVVVDVVPLLPDAKTRLGELSPFNCNL